MDTDKLPAILSTKDAARAINRKDQTLRKWASEGSGPIRPVRINGRLGWRVDDLRRLLECDSRPGAA